MLFTIKVGAPNTSLSNASIVNFFNSSLVDCFLILSKNNSLSIFNFSINDLSPVTYQAKTLNLFELNNFIDIERASGSPLLSSHILERNKRYTLPVTILILTILAVTVASNKKRGGIGLNLALGIILAFIFIFFDKLFSVLVSKSDWNPNVGAWLPNFVFLIITYYIFKLVRK